MEVRAAVLAAGGFTWQNFYNNGTNVDNLIRPGPCASQLAEWCRADSPSQTRAILYGFNGSAHHHAFNSTWLLGWEQDLAAFLLLRGPYSFLGYGWVDTNAEYYWPPALSIDFGEATELCHETVLGSGVYTRDFTLSTVSLDCNTWTPTITMKPR